MEEW